VNDAEKIDDGFVLQDVHQLNNVGVANSSVAFLDLDNIGF
jgi:hypothetical protein